MSQRLWWNRPRSNENPLENGHPNALSTRRSPLVSALSFASRSKPKRSSDAVFPPIKSSPPSSSLPSSQTSPVATSLSDGYHRVATPPQSRIAIPPTQKSVVKNRVYSKTLPSDTPRPQISTSAKIYSIPSPAHISPCKPNMDILPPSGKVIPASQLDKTFAQRLTLKRDRLPLPKAPPLTSLPPTPTIPDLDTPEYKYDEDALSPSSHTSRSSKLSGRTELLSPHPSHSTLSSGASRDSLKPVSAHINLSQAAKDISTIQISRNSVTSENSRHMFIQSLGNHSAPDSIPTDTQYPVPRRQSSLQQLNHHSFFQGLRHASSFSPSIIGDGATEPSVYVSTTEPPFNSPSLYRHLGQIHEHNHLRNSQYSNPETSFRALGREEKCEDSRSVLSLPLSGVPRSMISNSDQQRVASATHRQHIVPPDHLDEWINVPADRTILPERKRQGVNASSMLSTYHTLPPDNTPSSSYNSDDQTLPALCPPPRRRLGLAARRQAAKDKTNGALVSRLPISASTTTSSGCAGKSRPGLHRSTSFLTLEEEEDKLNGAMLTHESVGPNVDWESDAESGLGESFFDFGRGVNSLDLGEGLSD